MAIITKTIKPAGGGDYTSLFAWADWAKNQDENDELRAECYGGGDLGEVEIVLWLRQADTVIYAAAGERHAGSYDANKARIIFTGVAGIYCKVGRVKIKWLQFYGTSGIGSTAIHIEGSSALDVWVDGNLILSAPGNVSKLSTGVMVYQGPEVTVVNNIVCRLGDDKSGTSYQMSGSVATPTDAKFYNNVSVHAAYGFNMLLLGAWPKATVKNCVAVGSTTADFTKNDTAVVTADHNCSEDATGDDFGGGNNLINQTAADLFTNLNSNWTIPATSPLYNAGTAIGSFSTDAVGTARPQGPAWDIGAIERPV